MSRLTQWLDHRMEVVAIEKWKDLADQSGVPLQTLRDASAYGTLAMLNRSERRFLAAALRVSLGRLEKLGDGEIDWIDDDYFYDAGVRGRPGPSHELDPNYWTPKVTNAEDRGTPLVGRIRSSGKADPDEDWQPDWGRYIPKRFGKGHEIYALEVEVSGESVVLRNVPPWEFRQGQAAVYCWNGWEAEGWFGNVCLQASRARVVTADGQRHDLDVVNVVRIGKIIWRGSPLSA
jgi:hypothetical protein